MSKVTVFKAVEVRQAVEKNKGLILVHFGSPLASPCEFVRQELEMLSSAFPEGLIEFAEVELPLKDFELIQEFKIEEVPTLILFKENQEVERMEKILLPEELKEFLELAVSYYQIPPKDRKRKQGGGGHASNR